MTLKPPPPLCFSKSHKYDNYHQAPHIVSCYQVFVDVSKKSKAAIEIYVYTSESSRFALLENGIGYYAMA